MSMPKGRSAEFIAVLGIVAALPACKTAPPPPVATQPPDEAEACAEDTKVCPDGTTLARSGPDCRFPACRGGDPDSLSPDPAPAGPDGGVSPQPMGTFGQPDNPPG